jgi:hypothetical protein
MGRGWAKLEDGQLHGMIVIHLGDESDFVAKRAEAHKLPAGSDCGRVVHICNNCAFRIERAEVSATWPKIIPG